MWYGNVHLSLILWMHLGIYFLFKNFAKLKFLDDQQFPTKAKSFKYKFLSLNNIHMLLTLALSLVKIRWPWWGLCHLPFDQVQTYTSQNKMPNSHPEICASISITPHPSIQKEILHVHIENSPSPRRRHSYEMKKIIIKRCLSKEDDATCISMRNHAHLM